MRELMEVKTPDRLRCPIHGDQTTFRFLYGTTTDMGHVPSIVDADGLVVERGYDPNGRVYVYACTQPDCPHQITQTRQTRVKR